MRFFATAAKGTEPALRDELRELRMPGVRAELIRLSSVYTRDDPETWKKIQSTGDAAIVGVGH